MHEEKYVKHESEVAPASFDEFQKSRFDEIMKSQSGLRLIGYTEEAEFWEVPRSSNINYVLSQKNGMVALC